MAFLTMNFVEMFEAVCMRSQKKSIFKLGNMNWWMVVAFIGTAVFTLSVIFIPYFVDIFGFARISMEELLIAFGLAIAIVPIIEIQKKIMK